MMIFSLVIQKSLFGRFSVARTGLVSLILLFTQANAPAQVSGPVNTTTTLETLGKSGWSPKPEGSPPPPPTLAAAPTGMTLTNSGITWIEATSDAGWSARQSHVSIVYKNKL
jgi:hypothetical protein